MIVDAPLLSSRKTQKNEIFILAHSQGFALGELEPRWDENGVLKLHHEMDPEVLRLCGEPGANSLNQKGFCKIKRPLSINTYM
jgi:hypothetical protein